MRRDVLSALCHHVLREATAHHLALALGVLLLSSVLALGPLSIASSSTAAPESQDAAVQAEIESVEPDSTGGAPARESDPSSRGFRAESAPTETLATAPPAITPVVPSPTSVPPTPSPTTAPAPTATLAPTEAAPPSPTAAPTTPPTPKPAVAQAAQFRVGIQAGHWKESELPSELASLRSATGAAGNGWREVDVNLNVAQHVAAILRDRGILVDVLPATVPAGYKADAFVSVHGDANSNPSVSGYKLARARWSKIPQREDALIQAISGQYSASTGLKEHLSTITEDMRQYYAFNWQGLQHAVAPTTPSAIIELGFLTTASDRKLLLEQPDRAAAGIANGIVKYLGVK